jgi:hypothetical protein
MLAVVPLLLVGTTLPSAGVAVPLAHREVLPSGARLLVAPRPAIPIVVVRVYVRAGRSSIRPMRRVSPTSPPRF